MPRQPADQGAQVGAAFGRRPLVARPLARTPFPVRIREEAAPTAHRPPATPPETLTEAACVSGNQSNSTFR